MTEQSADLFSWYAWHINLSNGDYCRLVLAVMGFRHCTGWLPVATGGVTPCLA